MLEETEKKLLEEMHRLPHRVGEGTDWFEAPNGYPWHANVLRVLQPSKYVEFGAHVGYSLLAAVYGADSLQEVAWADNESYVPESNRLAQENLTAYIQRTGRIVNFQYCGGVESLLEAEPESAFLAPFQNADVLFVDGEHRNEGSLRDMRLAKQLGAKVIMVDDATSNCDPDVIQSIRQFSQEEGCPFGIVPTYRGLAIFDFSILASEPSPVFTRLREAGVALIYPAVAHPIASSDKRADDRPLTASSLISPERLEALCSLLATAPEAGEVWECGVYQGGSALWLERARQGRPLRLFDTFQGHPVPDPLHDHPNHPAGRFSETSETRVRSLFAGCSDVHIYPGAIPDTFRGFESVRLSFVHLDMDLYASTRAALAFCWERLLPGGIIALDDYGTSDCPGVPVALHGFSERMGCLLEYAPTHLVYVRKPE
ncbi:hypothetical protein LBMAG21_10240 [Armatimonadota bacterium]|nr:hypothetical protein LBMAG21_10240 [Armatimonadota bacterium]